MSRTEIATILVHSAMRLVGLSAVVVLPGVSAAEARLSSPVASVSIARSFGDKPIPKWENGFLVAFDSDQVPATVTAYGRTGRPVTEASIYLPELHGLVLKGTAASPMGVLAVTGSAWTADGRAAAFIAWINPTGAVDRVVRTAPFGAFKLCFSQDETLWAVGRELNPDHRGEPPHDVLRHYDREGRLLQSLLPKASFPRYDDRHPGEMAVLAASGNRVGLYSARAREWIEVSVFGSILGRWKGVDTGSPLATRGVAFTSDGSVYLSMLEGGGAQPRTQVYKLNKQLGTWERVATSGPYARILGADGNQVVVTPGLPQLLWIRPE